MASPVVLPLSAGYETVASINDFPSASFNTAVYEALLYAFVPSTASSVTSDFSNVFSEGVSVSGVVVSVFSFAVVMVMVLELS